MIHCSSEWLESKKTPHFKPQQKMFISQERLNVCRVIINYRPFAIMAHSTRPVTHVTGGFTGLRPPVGTYDLRSYGGEHQKVEADRRLSPNWHFLCTESAQRVRKWVTCVTSEKGPTLGTLESAGPIPRGPSHT